MNNLDWNHFYYSGQDAARAMWGKIPAEGYPINQYTMSGSWQARAWRRGFDTVRRLQQGANHG